MLDDLLREIEQAEVRAEQIKKNATAEAARLVSEAKRKRAELLEKREALALEDEKQLLQETEEKTFRQTEDRREELKQELLELRQKTEDRFDSAVSVIWERIGDL